jgi:glycosyltransferase involved in cell wall biosynthesis
MTRGEGERQRAGGREAIRVLLVNQPTDGGVAFHVATLAQRLPEHGVDTTVACPPGPYAQRLMSAGVAVVEVPMVREIAIGADLGALHHLRSIAGEGRHDLIHTHSAKAGVLGRLVARSRHLPAVHTPHAWSFLAADGQRRSQVYHCIERALARSTAAIICVSEGERRRGLQVADAERLAVVTNGIALPAAIPLPPRGEGERQRAGGRGAEGEGERKRAGGRGAEGEGERQRAGGRGEEGEGAVVGTVARLAPQKGIAHLLEAFAQVHQIRSDVRLAIAGDGPLRTELERLAEQLEIAHAVTFTGDVASPWPFLAGLDVFVLPSLWEGLPYALLEAMAVGLPTVATAVDGVAEAIPDRRFGTVVEPADSAWMAREILALLEDPGVRAEVGQMARAHVRDVFSVDAMVRDTVEIYRRVLRGSRAAGVWGPATLTMAGSQ